MENFLEHPDFYNTGIRNNFAEVTPAEVFTEYCRSLDLASVRSYLWNYFVVASTTANYPFEEATERSNLLFFVTETEKVLEAVFMFHEKRKYEEGKSADIL